MPFRVLLAASAAILSASALNATTVNNTDLPNVSGNYGAGVATTTTNANGTVTTVNGPGGSANRANAPFATNKWLQENVGGNASVGITKNFPRSGNGSAFFQGLDGNSKADLEYYFATPVPLASVTSLSYDWYRDASSTTNGIQVPSLRLAVTNGAQFAYLIYEPVYNGLVGNAPTNAWQTSSITTSSTFWSNNNNLLKPVGTAACPDCFLSLSSWQTANPNWLVYGLSTGIGSGWSGSFLGGVDNISYNFGAFGSGSFNFEVAAGVPEPATWAMMIAGLGLAGAAMRRRATKIVFA